MLLRAEEVVATAEGARARGEAGGSAVSSMGLSSHGDMHMH